MVRDFGPVGTDITVFAVAKSNTPNWTGHSWIANSRERNGFLFHNSNNAKSIYGNVLDRDKRYLGTPSVDWPDVESPHVYAIQYNERMWKNHIYLDHRVGIDYIDRDRYRDGSDSISIRLGKDFRDRYGDGKLGEMIYYKEDIGNTRRILVSNYLASKYQIDLNVEKRFDFDAEFKYDVAGIGRTSDLDFHEAAKSYPLFIVSPQNQKNGNYLMWGHNNAPLRWDSVKTGNGLLMKRYWKVSETGDYGSVTLRVDTHALNNAQKEIALRIGTLSEIKNNTGGRTIVLSPNRDYFEASVDFENGEYFTFITSDDLFSGVESFASLNRARLVPNPAINGLSELVFHAESSGEFQMNVMDNSGRILIARTGVSGSGTNRVDIDLSGYASGIYLIILQSENQKTVLKQIR
jgi:hypothetical protein